MEFVKDLLLNYELDEKMFVFLSSAIWILIVAVMCVVANFITKKIILRLLTHFINKSNFKMGSIFIKRKLFHKLSHLVPAVIIYFSAASFPEYQAWIEKVALFYIIAVVLVALNALLNSINDIYQSYEVSKARPIKGFIQILKIVIFIVGGIALISILIEKNPILLLSGLGALSAVLMLIFKDSVLGFVAGVQLASNDMVRIGDWIEMPKYNADGDVIDITLSTVKVQNWDKTITMVPSYAFVSDSFKNWRGMQDIGGRRIKRSVYIDTVSVQFCTEEMIERFKKIHYLTDYIEQKEKEIESYNRENNINTVSKVNGRNLTNIGTFRVYIQNYLLNHPLIHKEMTTMVRQLAPGENGLPLEVYCFTNDTRWVNYESVQADIFDHIFSVAPEFGLRIYQKPSGYDMHGVYIRSDN